MRGPYGESDMKLAVATPPVDGQANAAVERFLADLLVAAPSSVSVVRGASSRDRTVLVRGAREDEVAGRLGPLL